ncbi:uncharacterized protein L969DRAFT_50475 [Mixia osmundae IAM 14324]|uniref:glutathione transferase n=1 Tax=Mixia osmundae (strain CBS 9802 / IAM 14324 / JCM 22182 / KY 12970) TaxID=764103 RepID=G7E6R8_MIXOS|nr:uncharacterized protein L969DRAFT_50475 [Mixia osmundae IAM 14324]KEI39091.1 hypothetical protein L969DRAFT_50475 [Mixia osmundae IAM 14324]GAA98528.1 hypothetical protein E5Q_05215 [Mixia osmundae IAM 14324]
MSKVTVHHLNNSRSTRVLWLLEELGIPYDIVQHKRGNDLLAQDDLKAVHPMGKAPVITVDGATIAESGACIEYILARFGQDSPLRVDPASKEYADYIYWMHCAEGSVMSTFILNMMLGRVASSEVRKQIMDPRIKTALSHIEAQLARHDGKGLVKPGLTAADIQMSTIYETVESMGLLPSYPSIEAFYKSMHANPHYKEAESKGGPVDFKAFLKAKS